MGTTSDRPNVLRVALTILMGVIGLGALGAWLKPVVAAAVYPQIPASSASPITSTSHLIYAPVMFREYGYETTPFGVQMYGALTANNGLTRVVESKAGWVRYPVSWRIYEPARHTYNWASLDVSMQAVQSNNFQLIATITDNPAWAATSSAGPVTNTADLIDFVSAVVARYPQVKYWEFYNEPDNYAFYGLKAPAYAAMLQAVYPAVKAANPNAQVVMGGLALDWFISEGGPFDPDFLTNVMASCAGPCFDIANFHYYPLFRQRWEPYGRDIIGKANYVRQVMAAHGYTRPVFATETSWPTAAWGTGSEIQARWLPKSYVRGLAGDLPAVIWYSVVDMDSSNPALFDVTWTPRPAYTAFRTLTSVMKNARYMRTIPTTETGSDRIEAYQFSVPGLWGRKRLDVYWYECLSMSSYVSVPTDCNSVASLKINATSVARTDKLGVRTVVNDADDGHSDGYVTLSVSSSPIYIDFQP